jgi:hypothetical protein
VKSLKTHTFRLHQFTGTAIRLQRNAEIPHRNQASSFTGTGIPQPARRSVKSVSVTLSPARRHRSVSQSQCLTLSPARRPPLSTPFPFSLLHCRVCTPNLRQCRIPVCSMLDWTIYVLGQRNFRVFFCPFEF